MARTTLWIWLLGVALASSASAQQSKTWAVIIGVSQFSKLPGNQQLEYAAKDAEAFAKFITSPRGGGVPAENVTLMLNGEATGAALKRRLGTTLPRNAGPNDVVYIFLSTHGIVEMDAAKGVYILGSDGEPTDLYGTAVPMVELDQIISNRLQKAGRIVLLADLANSETMAGGVYSSLQRIAGKRRELIGLMASRAPKPPRRVPSSVAATVPSPASSSKGWTALPMLTATRPSP